VSTEAERAYRRDYYIKHKEEIAARVREQRKDPIVQARLSATNRKYHAANRERRHAQHQVWREKNAARILFNGAKTRARKQGLAFDLTLADEAIPERCPVFGLVLQVGVGRGGGPGHNSPTLDRIDPSRGYVRGNVAVISHYANFLKSKATAAEHRRIAEWMESF
jgi:hypothetical protein